MPAAVCSLSHKARNARSGAPSKLSATSLSYFRLYFLGFFLHLNRYFFCGRLDLLANFFSACRYFFYLLLDLCFCHFRIRFDGLCCRLRKYACGE